MRRTLATTGIIAASLTALAISVTPVMAATGGWGPGDGTGTCTSTTAGTGNAWGNGTGTGQANGMGARRGMQGQGFGQGAGQGAGMNGSIANLEQGTLTAAQKVDLAAMAEEEKMAHDVYVTLAEQYPDLYQFSRIARAESQHLSLVQALLDRYGIADPTTGMDVGEFTSAAFQDLYDELVAGATTATKALQAGVTVEKTDIADLKAAMSDITAPDVLQVYTNLLKGSERHLAAFSR
jgi:hypothetical protein